MKDSRTNDSFMSRAIELAKLGRGHVEPNPMVGCVIVKDHAIVGEGYHERFGGPHAEVNALASVKALAAVGDAQSDAVRDATAFVTLEPCCHHGKTPPCTGALISAGVAKVVVGAVDPFAKVDGGGIAQLRAAGIEVEVGCQKRQCEDLIAPFAKQVRTGLPWVTAKWAMTIDGRIATRTGSSQWITGDAARADVHQNRAASDGILVGMGTVRRDDPVLTARPAGDAATRILHRMVLCRNSLPSLQSRLVQTAAEHPLHLIVGPSFATDLANDVTGAHLRSLRDMNVRLVHCQNDDDIAREAVRWAGDLGMTNLIVEGGGQVLGSFFDSDLIDQCDVYVGGKVVGGADSPGPVAGVGVDVIDAAKRFSLGEVSRLGDDVKLCYRRV